MKINIRLKNTQEKILFLDRMREIKDIEFSIRSKSNTIKIKLFGTRDQQREAAKRIKDIQGYISHAMEEKK
jgi:hypothetical protein